MKQASEGALWRLRTAAAEGWERSAPGSTAQAYWMGRWTALRDATEPAHSKDGEALDGADGWPDA